MSECIGSMKRRRLCRQYTLVNPELAPLYPDDKSAMTSHTDTSSEVIVLGRSQPVHSRKRKTGSLWPKPWTRILQHAMTNLPSSDVLDLHNHEFIPSNIRTAFPAQPQPIKSPPTDQIHTQNKQPSPDRRLKKRRSLMVRPVPTLLRRHTMVLRSTTRKRSLMES